MSDQPLEPVDHRSRALQPVSTGQRAIAFRGAARSKSILGESPISPAFLLWVFKKWWKIALPMGVVLAAIAGVLVWYLHVPQYQAKALLMIQGDSPYVAFAGGRSGVESARYVQTQLELLRSQVVLEPVIARPEIASIADLAASPSPVDTLRSGLSIQGVGQSDLYYVGYVSALPETAAKVVNAIVNEYLTFQMNDDAHRAQRVIDILEDERRRRAVEVERLRKRLVDLAKEVTGRDPYTGSAADFKRSLNPIGSLFQNLTELDLEREMLKAKMQFLKEAEVEAKDPLESSGLLTLDIDSHPETTKRETEITEIRKRLDEIKEAAIRYQKNPQWQSSPAYVALEKELELREADLADFKVQLKKMILLKRKEQRQLDSQQEVAQLGRQLEMLDRRNEVLSKRFADQLSSVTTGEGKGVELEFARAELRREEKVFELIASRKLALQTELRAPARIQLTRKADVPIRPVEPIPYKQLLMACSAALFVPLGLALAKELLVRRISDVDQLSEELRLRVLGEIAELPVRHVAISSKRISGRLQRDAHVFAESVNSLRTNIAIAEDLRDKKVLAIMSASSGESKSSVATSLAMSIANAATKPTLLIDGDLRSPDVAAMLKTKAQPGLFEVLSGKCTLEEAIHHVGDSQLYVMPAGRATRSTHHIVKVPEMKALLAKLRPKFATILIDTPPILGASESLVLGKVADAVIFCSLSGESKVKQTRVAVERLEHAGVNVAGAVLSGSSVRGYAYRYGYYPVESSSR